MPRLRGGAAQTAVVETDSGNDYRPPSPVSTEQVDKRSVLRRGTSPRKPTTIRGGKQPIIQPNSEETTSDSPDDDTEMMDYAATAQLRAEAARQGRKFPEEGPRTSGRAGVNVHYGDAPAMVSPVSPPQARNHLVSDPPTMSTVPRDQLTPQEEKDEALDIQVRDALNELRLETESFCNDFFDGKVKPSVARTYSVEMDELPRELISYAGCIADGGPDGEKGWTEICKNSSLRKALVYGIIQRALKEHVFGSLLFGAPGYLLERLEAMEEAHEDKDGFFRADQRAQCITSFEIDNRIDILSLETNGRAILEFSLQLTSLLHSFHDFLGLHSNVTNLDVAMTTSLIPIVTAASSLSYLMRRNGQDVVYYFSPIFKDEILDPVRMEITNYHELLSEGAAKRHHVSPLVKIICAFQLVAYRKGGGVMAERALKHELTLPKHDIPPEWRSRHPHEWKGRIITAKDGYRTKLIAKGIVAGRLGKPRHMGGDVDDDEGKYVDLMTISQTPSSSRCGVM